MPARRRQQQRDDQRSERDEPAAHGRPSLRTAGRNGVVRSTHTPRIRSAWLGAVAAYFAYWGGAANKIFGETIPIQDPGLDVTLREPVGVCALITPWNFPLLIATWKIAPALACGNTVVVKPASYTPLSTLALAGILVEAGLPPEAISV